MSHANILSATTTTKSRGPMWGAAGTVAAVFMLSNSPTPLYEHWRTQLNFSSGTLTVIFAVYIASLLGTLLVAGQLSDRYGRKPVLLPGLLAALLACLLFSGAESVAALGAARLLAGIAVGVVVTAGMAAVADLGGEARTRQAALLASVAMVFGAGLGPLLSGAVAQDMQRPVAIVFGVQALVLISAIIVVLFLPMRRPARRDRAAWTLRLPSVPRDARRHLVLGISVFGPGITATSFVLSLGPSLLSRLLHVHSPLIAGGMACAMFLAATGSQFAARRLSVRGILLSGAAATVLAMFSLALAVNGAIALALLIAALLAGAGQGLGQLGGLTLIGLNIRGSRRAEANAVLNIAGYIPAGLLPVATGYLVDIAGMPVAVTVFASAVATAALAGGLLVWREPASPRPS
ncbi:MFS transporter [Bordetella sp. H567]|uniref:MFS transporter n=1 Tax=Bordetella sp. H567 TaxID=1697043 RepID=UPI00081CFD0D|nr:MFS transporter [Bordetella sp. H567]AOB29754.1 MFS transporter [Bordetella sp. H567]